MVETTPSLEGATKTSDFYMVCDSVLTFSNHAHNSNIIELSLVKAVEE